VYVAAVHAKMRPAMMKTIGVRSERVDRDDAEGA
jgi:hypothetical protein